MPVLRRRAGPEGSSCPSSQKLCQQFPGGSARSGQPSRRPHSSAAGRVSRPPTTRNPARRTAGPSRARGAQLSSARAAPDPVAGAGLPWAPRLDDSRCHQEAGQEQTSFAARDPRSSPRPPATDLTDAPRPRDAPHSTRRAGPAAPSPREPTGRAGATIRPPCTEP